MECIYCKPDQRMTISTNSDFEMENVGFAIIELIQLHVFDSGSEALLWNRL